MQIKPFFSTLFRNMSRLYNRYWKRVIRLSLLAILGGLIAVRFWTPAIPDPVVEQGPILHEPPVVVVAADQLPVLVRRELETLLAADFAHLRTPPEVQLPPDVAPVPLPEPEPELTISFDQISRPVMGEVTNEFGWHRHPVHGDWRYFDSVGMNAQPHDPVVSVLPGRVKTVLPLPEGYEVIVEHGSGWQSVYRQLTGLAVVPGDQVDQNQIIANTNHSGQLVFSLHFEQRPLDPRSYF